MSNPNSPVPVAPAGGTSVNEIAVAFADGGGSAVRVDDTHPLPVTIRQGAAASSPLTGASTAGGVLGPFTPDTGRAIELRLWGSWSGSVIVRDSIDGGTTKLPLTVGGQPWGGPFTGNVNEEEIKTPHVAGQTFWLDATVSAGTLNYWMGQ